MTTLANALPSLRELVFAPGTPPNTSHRPWVSQHLARLSGLGTPSPEKRFLTSVVQGSASDRFPSVHGFTQSVFTVCSREDRCGYCESRFNKTTGECNKKTRTNLKVPLTILGGGERRRKQPSSVQMSRVFCRCQQLETFSFKACPHLCTNTVTSQQRQSSFNIEVTAI